MHTPHTEGSSFNLDVESDWPPIEGTVDCIDMHGECSWEKLGPCQKSPKNLCQEWKLKCWSTFFVCETE